MTIEIAQTTKIFDTSDQFQQEKRSGMDIRLGFFIGQHRNLKEIEFSQQKYHSQTAKHLNKFQDFS